jgi:hypothetical protein
MSGEVVMVKLSYASDLNESSSDMSAEIVQVRLVAMRDFVIDLMSFPEKCMV